MTTTDTRAAIHAAIRDLFLGSSTPAVARVTIDAAITAHVEAEVTRRLAAAPGVETALAAYGTAVYELGYVLHRPDRDAVLRPVKDAAEATLRAAIAADRERAVETGSLTALDEFRKLLPKYVTPDEARRLVEEFDVATRDHVKFAAGPPHLDPAEAAYGVALAALLRALGVEA